MRILHVSDLHFRADWFEWVSAECGRFDLVAVAGDLLDAFADNLGSQARCASAWLLSLETPTVVCSGNHDYWVADPHVVDRGAEARWLTSLRRRGKIVASDGDLLERDGETILSVGWIGSRVAPCTILVAHAPPNGCACSTSRDDLASFGDDLILDSLPAPGPRLLLCGHVHRPLRYACRLSRPDARTTVLNPGFEKSAVVPNHWIIETARHTAVHNLGVTAKW